LAGIGIAYCHQERNVLQLENKTVAYNGLDSQSELLLLLQASSPLTDLAFAQRSNDFKDDSKYVCPNVAPKPT